VLQPHGSCWHSFIRRKLLLSPAWLRPIKRRVDFLLPRIREFRQLAERQNHGNWDVLVALSRAAADDFEKDHAIARERIRVVYHGVDLERFNPGNRAVFREAVRGQLGIRRETILALIVAHNFRLKGVPTLLRAMRKLQAEQLPFHLVVVGGRHLRRWRRMVRSFRIEEAVTFAGPVDDPAPYYAAADVYAHPTFYDTFGLVLLEAAATGLPLITASSYNGAAELFTDGLDALFISDPADADEVAERMRGLRDETVRRAMGSAARRTALKHPFERNVEEILAVYERIVESRRRGAKVGRAGPNGTSLKRPAACAFG
jgi:UDP-glucose:(heptosyl)LPS alpha-1,3-glucosyltransferase